MTHRSGATLMEVLVAIFVTAIGLLALLALFPLGALNMAQAIKDERAAECAGNATAVCNTKMFLDATPPANGGPLLNDLRYDNNVLQAFLGPYPNPPGPNGQLPSLGSSAGACYPVLVDPIGYWAYSGSTSAAQWVGGQDGTTFPMGVPRINPTTFNPLTTPGNPAANYQLALRWCSLLDDINFSIPSDGTPKNAQVQVQRDLRYSWAWLLRRPYAGSSGVAVVDLSVVVFQGRGLQLSTGSQPLDETPYSAAFASAGKAANVVTLTWDPTVGQQPPRVRKGSWILDSTMNASQPTPDPHGYFYRVTNVTQSGPNSVDLETQTALKASGFTGTAVVMESVVEVFERGIYWDQY